MWRSNGQGEGGVAGAGREGSGHRQALKQRPLSRFGKDIALFDGNAAATVMGTHLLSRFSGDEMAVIAPDAAVAAPKSSTAQNLAAKVVSMPPSPRRRFLYVFVSRKYQLS